VNRTNDGSSGRDDASQARADFPVVGIGTSAGGIDALKMFFSAATPDSNLAFVVVQHLDPEHKSILQELLARAVSLPVHIIENGVRVAPNHVYVIPPNAALTIQDGALQLTPPTEPRDQRTPIDTFFTSLASERAENAACVIPHRRPCLGGGTDRALSREHRQGCLAGTARALLRARGRHLPRGE
jgi:two-component system, chemotaxis family, CheB/CheR fusion protein